VKKLRGSNGMALLAVTGAAILVTALGLHHVWLAQKTLFFRRAVFVELQRNRALVQERDILERQVAELRAAPRVAWRARELLGMRPPRPDEMIVVRPDADDPSKEGSTP
jgi:cell division protein FtsB